VHFDKKLLPLVLQADDGGDGACRRLSLESKPSTLDGGVDSNPEAPSDAAGTLQQASSGSTQLEQPQGQLEDDEQMPGWPQDDDMVVIQEWDDSSLAQYDALDVAAAAAAPAAGTADAAAAEQRMQQQPAAAPGAANGERLGLGRKACCIQQFC
jgi:hypothetical protein